MLKRSQYGEQCRNYSLVACTVLYTDSITRHRFFFFATQNSYVR